MGEPRKGKNSKFRTAISLLSDGWPVILFITVLAGIAWGYLGAGLTVLGFAGVILWRAGTGLNPTEKRPDHTKRGYREALEKSTNELRIARDTIRYLKETLASRDEIEEDEGLRDRVFKLVSACLTAYDTSQGRVTPSDTIEALRAMLMMLGREYPEDQTRHFTEEDWKEAHEWMAGFSRGRR